MKKKNKMNKTSDKKVSTPKIKYKMGDEVTLKLGGLQGIITGIITKESYKEYEVTYFTNEHRRAMVSRFEMVKGHEVIPDKTIGFKNSN